MPERLGVSLSCRTNTVEAASHWYFSQKKGR